MVAMPLRTSSHFQVSSSIRGSEGRVPPPAMSARGKPAASGRRMQVASLWSRRPQTAVSPSSAAADSPTAPRSGSSALASLSLQRARITNIDSRFKVAGSTLAWQANSSSSAAGFHITKLARRRPLAEQ